MVGMPDSVAVNTGVASECGNCRIEERKLLHHVSQRNTFRRLCTGCVLRLHPQSFCPTCFQLHPSPPPNDAVISCVRCHSISHHRCVVEAMNPLSKPYNCPLCVSPSTPIFKLKSAKGISFETSKLEDCRVIDADGARKLLAAAKIASISMNKAAAAARQEAERRAMEAALTRKRARDALENLANLVKEDKSKKKESSSTAATVGAYPVHSVQNLKPGSNENGNGEQLPNGESNSSRVGEKTDGLEAAVGDLVGESDDEGCEVEAMITEAFEEVEGLVAEIPEGDMQNGSHNVFMDGEQHN